MSREVPCSCKGHSPKHIPYGSKRSKGWCGCDKHLVCDVNKRAHRQKIKKEIRKEINGM